MKKSMSVIVAGLVLGSTLGSPGGLLASTEKQRFTFRSLQFFAVGGIAATAGLKRAFGPDRVVVQRAESVSWDKILVQGEQVNPAVRPPVDTYYGQDTELQVVRQRGKLSVRVDEAALRRVYDHWKTKGAGSLGVAYQFGYPQAPTIEDVNPEVRTDISESGTRSVERSLFAREESYSRDVLIRQRKIFPDPLVRSEARNYDLAKTSPEVWTKEVSAWVQERWALKTLPKGARFQDARARVYVTGFVKKVTPAVETTVTRFANNAAMTVGGVLLGLGTVYLLVAVSKE